MKVMAIGNRCMKDDGVAVVVAEHLINKLSDLDLDIIIAETDSLSGFYALDEDDYMIIIDAVHTGACPGSVYTFGIKEASANVYNRISFHDMNIIDLLNIYRSKVEGLLIGIEVSEIGMGDGLSMALAEKLPQIHSEVEGIILEYCCIKNRLL